MAISLCGRAPTYRLGGCCTLPCAACPAGQSLLLTACTTAAHVLPLTSASQLKPVLLAQCSSTHMQVAFQVVCDVCRDFLPPVGVTHCSGGSWWLRMYEELQGGLGQRRYPLEEAIASRWPE